MKLTKDHYIEGKIYEAGTQYEIVEADNRSDEDKKQAKAVMDKFAKGELKTKDGKVVTNKDQAIAMSYAISKSDNKKESVIKEKLTNTTIEQNLAELIASDLANSTDYLQKIINAVPPYSNLGDSILDLETKVTDRYYQVYHNFWDNANNDFINNAKAGEIEATLINTTLDSLGYKVK